MTLEYSHRYTHTHTHTHAHTHTHTLTLIQAAAAPGGVAPDVVISCPPSDPPYSLLSLCLSLATHLPISCQVHVHSSISGTVPPQLVEFWKGVPRSREPVLRVTLLWKCG